MNNKFSLGFSSLDKEVVIDELPIKGVVPSWLSGTLVRNGPAKFEVGEKKMNHWFDGFAMLHKFSFKNGKVSYANKFLESKAYKYTKEHGKINYSEFATDPCRSIFKRFTQVFFPKITDNTNVNISRIADEFVAFTETPLPIKFDLKTLKSLGVFNYDDKLKGMLTTAHPHYDFEKKEGINYITNFSAKITYNVYSLPDSTKSQLNATVKRNLISSVSVREAAYMHSFGMTKNYIILAEFPLFMNPFKLLFGEVFVKSLKWKDKGTNFIIIDRKTGKVKGQHRTESFFAFHHINAFEQDDQIVIDIAAYKDSSIIDYLYLDVLRGEINKNLIIDNEFRRYTILLADTDSLVSYKLIGNNSIELPRINYALKNTKDYQFVYGISLNKDNGIFFNQLIKINVKENKEGTSLMPQIWEEDDCYPGEPVFIKSPEAKNEDDGIILSVVLNSKKQNSFLLILDAISFQEIARAEVPHHIPFGFHGQFYNFV